MRSALAFNKKPPTDPAAQPMQQQPAAPAPAPQPSMALSPAPTQMSKGPAMQQIRGSGMGPGVVSTANQASHAQKFANVSQIAQPTNPYEQQAANAWAGIMAQHDAGLQGKLGQTYADEAAAGRRADVMNARLGRGVSGGGFAAGQAQVALGGMAQRQDVLNKHGKQGLEMKMAFLDTLIRRAEATKDRRLQEQLQAESDKTMLAMQGANLDTTSYASDAPDSGGGGGGSRTKNWYKPWKWRA